MNETALTRLLHLYAAPAVPVAPGDGITGRQSVQRTARRRSIWRRSRRNARGSRVYSMNGERAKARRRGQAERRRERAARGNA